jgi:GT2 family glycosyltransferase
VSTLDSSWTVITVSCNSSGDLARYWGESTQHGYRWIVVDNASTDDSVDVARRLGAHVIALGKNVGFSHANNIGLAEAASEFVGFVNPDVTVTPEGLEGLREILSNENALVAPQLVNPDGSKQPNGRGLPFLVDKIANRKVKLPGARPDLYTPVLGSGVQEVDWITGAVVCARAATFRELGAWNEKFFLYYEDQELSLRAWARGIRVLVETNIEWVHGWKRETAGFAFTPWRREIASLVKFSAMYPRLLFPWKRDRVKLGRSALATS